MSGRCYGPPWRLPYDVNQLRINYRCLEAPKPYMDLEGFWCMPPVIRRVNIGLIEAPKGFIDVVQPRAAHIAMLPIMERTFDFDFNNLPPYIFKFGVDLPYKRVLPCLSSKQW